MGGQIGVESRVEHGSVFWFTVPLPVCTNRPNVGGIADAQPVYVRARRVLVADDNPLNQLLATSMLERDGHIVTVAANGAEAVRAVEGAVFDLILMDMRMPVMDGIEATRYIRAMNGSASCVPIIALTANVLAEQVEECRKAGMNGHLAKPIDRELLRRTIGSWTSQDAGIEDSPPDGAAQGAQAPARHASGHEFQLDVLLELFDGDLAPVIALLETALQSIAADVEDIELGLQDGSLQRVTRAAHRLKGTCADLRADRLRAIAVTIERESKIERYVVEATLVRELRRAACALTEEIEAVTIPRTDADPIAVKES
jgi:CheY-like chemotaxis protein